MNSIKRIYSKNREVYRLLLIIVIWLIFMVNLYKGNLTNF